MKSLPTISTNTDVNSIGKALQRSFIWTAESPGHTKNGWLHGGFRKDVLLTEMPKQAQLHIFAYTRYMLFINGQYVGRGPNRFELRRPEYDTWNVTSHLKSGKNTIGIVVHRDWSTGKRGESLSRIRQHAPGLTAMLVTVDAAGARQQLATDVTWAGFNAKEFGPNAACYSSIPENIDARAGNEEWISQSFKDNQLPRATKVDTRDASEWPELEPRTIPLLRETSIPFTLNAGAKTTDASRTVHAENGSEIRLTCPRIVQAYTVLDIDATAGVTLKTSTRNTYVCREGKQCWIGGDTFAFRELSIKVSGGSAKITVADVREVLYPFDRVGQFSCSDSLLNKIWLLTANSTALLSEDAYTDCADRERSEWMDCDPPIYDASRVMMAGPGTDGTPLWSDPRLLKNMVLRVALSQVDSGMVKARTCSDLVDVHTFMEDRACDWISGIRKYYESTGDKRWVELLWPYVDRQVNWFLDRRQSSGLVRAREWIAWDNPLRYLVCEGTGNNAFFYRAITDAGYLAGQIGRQQDEVRLSTAAEAIRKAVNEQLWNDSAGAYWAGQGQPALVLTDVPQMRKDTHVPTTNGKMNPTMHANLYALDQGIVPPERFKKVADYTIRNDGLIKGIMSNYYYFKLLYLLDRLEYDQRVLDRIRTNWKAMADGPTQVTWESFSKGGSQMHCYGIVPGYTLSTYVLGVRRDVPVWKHQIIIEPHLADLTHAEGVVITEFGPVTVAWKKEEGKLNFQITVPENTQTTLALPKHEGRNSVQLDDQSQKGTVHGTRLIIELAPGAHAGSY